MCLYCSSCGKKEIIAGCISEYFMCFRILTGSCVGDEVLIPKIKLIHKLDQVQSVAFSQYQFPLAVYFTLTIASILI
ncbi:hypothetical protein VP01_2300g3 [Puccinia sorghi]|uniref:Uncharacterized protein n=1 Tax=Puccinia sorghi TaxID=27349 RepID=A0A0L6V7Y6_9BASI|nr:hypothetical protein VP01_2300g3 [Puccinia sorghi]